MRGGPPAADYQSQRKSRRDTGPELAGGIPLTKGKLNTISPWPSICDTYADMGFSIHHSNASGFRAPEIESAGFTLS